MKFLFIDVETNGLPKNYKASVKDFDNWPRIVQIAWIVADENQNILSQQNFLINSYNEGFFIPAVSVKIHGITNEFSRHNGTDLNIALQELENDIENVDYIVCHNADFDTRVIECEILRKNLFALGFSKIPTICTMKQTIDFCDIVAKNSRGNYKKFPKLEELHQKLFECNFDGAHDAMNDVKATMRCFYELIKINIIKL